AAMPAWPWAASGLRRPRTVRPVSVSPSTPASPTPTSTRPCTSSRRPAHDRVGGRQDDRDPPVTVLVVTGTDTGVGKTIVTAAIAAAVRARGLTVAVVKPGQTGGDDDAGVVARLAAPERTLTLASYPDPLAPLAAARVSGLPPLGLDAVRTAV